TGSLDGTAQLWNFFLREPKNKPIEHPGWVRAVGFSPDGETFLTGGADGVVRLWRTRTGKPTGDSVQHKGWVLAAAFSPDGKTVVSGSADRTAQFCEVTAATVEGKAEQIVLWIQVVTGMELEVGTGTDLNPYDPARVLDSRAWHERRRRL